MIVNPSGAGHDDKRQNISKHRIYRDIYIIININIRFF